ncbi:hypothetical protein Pan216_21290 [Planctomycetes bacterium Pan216]|uniref:DUF6948 domain-containing protein n=1 Tax=Kolteria novifilia TaxID=2527975 RepID=A0A518B2S1_9BACT|nr:hypothetical protein Pan216_21290 [Planctomycetes bacterium Pan216]
MDEKRPVLVTTQWKGVFFGQLESEGSEGPTGCSVALTGVRNCIYFGTEGGFLQLADTGPTEKSKIGSPAPRVSLVGVTSIVDCTPAAAEAWQGAKTHGS